MLTLVVMGVFMAVAFGAVALDTAVLGDADPTFLKEA